MKTYLFGLPHTFTHTFALTFALSLTLCLGLACSALAQNNEPTRTTGLNSFGPTVPTRIRVQQDSVSQPAYTWNIALMPLSFLGQGLELAGEVMVNKKTSLRLTGGYFLGTDPWFYSPAQEYSGARGELQLRFFSNNIQQTRQSMYVGPFLQVKTIRLTREGNAFPNGLTTIKTYNVTAPSFGVLVGWESVSPSGFLLDFFLGGGLIIPNDNVAAKEVQIDLINPYTQGVMLRAGIGLGLGR